METSIFSYEVKDFCNFFYAHNSSCSDMILNTKASCLSIMNNIELEILIALTLTGSDCVKSTYFTFSY